MFVLKLVVGGNREVFMIGLVVVGRNRREVFMVELVMVIGTGRCLW